MENEFLECQLWAMPGEDVRRVRILFYRSSTGKEMFRFVERNSRQFLREIDIPVERILNGSVQL